MYLNLDRVFVFVFCFFFFHLTQVFLGNTDRDTVVYHDLNPVIDARFVRVLPMEWFDFIGMRMELYSCQGKLLVNLFIPGWITVLNFQK